MLLAGSWLGLHAALSATLGGLVNVTAGTVSGMLATHGGKRTAGEALIGAFRAEAVRVALIVAQLWLVLAHYKQLVPIAFFGTFILTVIFFCMAIFVRDR
jgi:F0F1-type ATP synthase assembly protein I